MGRPGKRGDGLAAGIERHAAQRALQGNPAHALADVQQAHRDLEARKTTGCTILTL